MATPISVPVPITAAQFTTIDTNSASTEVILTLAKIDLTPEQTKSRLAVSVIRSSEIADVNASLVKTNTKAVPSTLDIPTYEADILYLNNLKQRQAAIAQQYNEITALVEVGQHNLMIKTNAILTNARTVAKTDKGVADEMVVLDAKYFVHSAPVAGIVHTIDIGGEMTLSGINAMKLFTNTEKTTLSILNVGGSATYAVRVNGFTSTHLPKEWVNVVITNLSITDAGAFNVFMK